MKLKLDAKGNAVLQDGKPVYVHTDGREEAFDAAGAMKLARGQAFAASRYVSDKLNIHHELAAAFFGGSFRLEKGQLVAYGAGGVPLYSQSRHGELANLDEALEQLVAKYPSKDMILRKDGVTPGQPGPSAGLVTRSQFEAMAPADRAKFINSGGRVGDGRASAPAPSHALRPTPDGKSVSRRTGTDRAKAQRTGGATPTGQGLRKAAGAAGHG
jgi:hypothetical protein